MRPYKKKLAALFVASYFLFTNTLALAEESPASPTITETSPETVPSIVESPTTESTTNVEDKAKAEGSSTEASTEKNANVSVKNSKDNKTAKVTAEKAITFSKDDPLPFFRAAENKIATMQSASYEVTLAANMPIASAMATVNGSLILQPAYKSHDVMTYETAYAFDKSAKRTVEVYERAERKGVGVYAREGQGAWTKSFLPLPQGASRQEDLALATSLKGAEKDVRLQVDDLATVTYCVTYDAAKAADILFPEAMRAKNQKLYRLLQGVGDITYEETFRKDDGHLIYFRADLTHPVRRLLTEVMIETQGLSQSQSTMLTELIAGASLVISARLYDIDAVKNFDIPKEALNAKSLPPLHEVAARVWPHELTRK